jgi:HAD superfamily hydrolase (TIGR01490 family)
MNARSTNTVALFDLDGTLVRENTGRLFIRYELDEGRASWLQVGRVLFWLSKYALGLGNANMVAMQGLSWYRGRTETELRADMTVWFQRRVKQHIPEAARRAVAMHLSRGDTVAIATAGSRYVAEQVAGELNIPNIVCTEVEVVDGKLSGQIIEPLCYGEGKAQRVEHWLRQRGESHNIVFYTDSITDLPLLEVVSTPIVINPDVRLKRLARSRGWPIEIW